MLQDYALLVIGGENLQPATKKKKKTKKKSPSWQCVPWILPQNEKVSLSRKINSAQKYVVAVFCTQTRMILEVV